MEKMVNYYNVLGISSKASKLEIKKAYRKLSLVWHPAKNSSKDSEEKFKEISKAYHTLINPELRLKYDNDMKQRQSYRSFARQQSTHTSHGSASKGADHSFGPTHGWSGHNSSPHQQSYRGFGHNWQSNGSHSFRQTSGHSARQECGSFGSGFGYLRSAFNRNFSISNMPTVQMETHSFASNFDLFVHSFANFRPMVSLTTYWAGDYHDDHYGYDGYDRYGEYF